MAKKGTTRTTAATPTPAAPPPACGKPSSLLETRVVYHGDNLEHLAADRQKVMGRFLSPSNDPVSVPRGGVWSMAKFVSNTQAKVHRQIGLLAAVTILGCASNAVDKKIAARQKLLSLDFDGDTVLLAELGKPLFPTVANLPQCTEKVNRCDFYIEQCDTVLENLTPPLSEEEKRVRDHMAKNKARVEERKSELVILRDKLSAMYQKNFEYMIAFERWLDTISVQDRVKVKDWNNAFKLFRMNNTYTSKEAAYKADQTVGVPPQFQGSEPYDIR